MGDRAPNEINVGVSRMPKRQKRASLQLKRHLHIKKWHKSEEGSHQEIDIPFFPKDQKSGISRGYCRDKGPKYGYWAVGCVQRHQVVREQVIVTETYRTVVCGRSLVMRNWKCCPRRSTSSAKQSRGHKSDLSLRIRHQTIILARINIRRG